MSLFSHIFLLNVPFMVLLIAQGHENVAAEYYKQQVEMLEGFSEMDAFTDRAFLPVMSKEEHEKVVRSESLAIWLSNIANMVLFAAKVYASKLNWKSVCSRW
ncbi:Electron transfer flavoprotein subunit alpha mitochondrial [Zea mays]|uniref:Electron transfer flavoprotein subunit alpha mitochondrial n=1 Tax=Zea mays TaxID=4577 RepID=A0A1D6F6C7_MAIZE|nr:Electron transfer flavoprotein subunit alpha mitochondrial [Zea mays]